MRLDKIKIILFLSVNLLLTVSLKSQNSLTCDSVINKHTWDNSFAFNKNLFADFDSNNNLVIFGNLNKNKKNGLWYYFTNNICDSICMFNNNKRIGKSYYFKNGDVSLVTYKWHDKKMDICYDITISKEHYLTASFKMDGCLQGGIRHNCNGTYKNSFPFNLATDKIEELCLRVGGISKPEYSYPSKQ